MSVVMKGGTTGNREKNAIVSMPTAPAQPVVNSASTSMSSNVHFTSEHSRSTHPDSAAVAGFMPKGCTIPENSPDVADPNA